MAVVAEEVEPLVRMQKQLEAVVTLKRNGNRLKDGFLCKNVPQAHQIEFRKFTDFQVGT